MTSKDIEALIVRRGGIMIGNNLVVIVGINQRRCEWSIQVLHNKKPSGELGSSDDCRFQYSLGRAIERIGDRMALSKKPGHAALGQIVRTAGLTLGDACALFDKALFTAGETADEVPREE